MKLDNCIVGDCLDVLKTLADCSVDAVVTDPPYGLSFMGKKWDYDVPTSAVWAECLRVLKPGGYVLAFAGTRTQHRMACAIEDGGFEIRDMIAWVYASGMPKHVSCLKPALEPITMARKPDRVSAPLNIDACRVPTADAADAKGYAEKCASVVGLDSNRNGQCYGEWSGERRDSASLIGRWPANLIHDGSAEVVELFPESAGAGGSIPNVKISGYGDGIGNGKSEYFGGKRTTFDSGNGSAARFFYCAKANKADREEGLEKFEKKRGGAEQFDSRWKDGVGELRQPVRANVHPTVKPTDLMRYLCRLVTPPGGIVLDPFAGSGSTGKAAILEGFRFIGIEREAEYAAIAMARIEDAIATRFDMTRQRGLEFA